MTGELTVLARCRVNVDSMPDRRTMSDAGGEPAGQYGTPELWRIRGHIAAQLPRGCSHR